MSGQKTKAILILGDKGGVGKTFIAGLVYDWLRSRNVPTDVWNFDGGRTLTPGEQ